MADTAFQYAQLDGTGDDFRLLRLRGSSGGEIECELFHAAFDTEPYEALSYCWGSPELVESIKVNGKKLRITDSLHGALLHLRRHDRDRVLWIDAVCIDQDAHVERSHQVRKMRGIFRQAIRVIIWLGKATAAVEALMHWIGGVKEQDHVSETASEDEQLRQGLRTLLNRPWFSRVWVLQEVANAKSAIICAGNSSVRATAFARAPDDLGVPASMHCKSVLDLMERTTNPSSEASETFEQDLVSLAIRFRRCKATDERDKIFALQGLCRDGMIPDDLLPDYALDTATVVRRLSNHFFETEHRHNSDILDFVGSFSTLTAVCLMATKQPLDEWLTDPRESFAQMNEVGLTQKMSLLCLEERPTSEYDVQIETCYTEAVQLASRPSNELRGTTYHGEAQDMMLLAYIGDSRGAIDAIFRADDLGLYRVFDFILEYYSNDWDFLRFAVREALLKARAAAILQIFKLRGADLAETMASELLDGLAMWSAEGNEKMVRVLLDLGTDVKRRADCHRTLPLNQACRRGHAEVVAMLLGAGADVHAKGDKEQLPLIEASRSESNAAQRVEIVRMLLDAGADVNARVRATATTNKFDWSTPLICASRHGTVELVRILLDAGADVNAKSQSNEIPLLCASEFNGANVLQVLMNAGADVHARSSSYETPLHKALQLSHEKRKEGLECPPPDSAQKVRILLDAGADASARNDSSITPLHVACNLPEHNFHLEVVNMLLGAGADARARDSLLSTALHHASYFPHVDAILKLLDAGADVNARDSNQDTPLHAAVKSWGKDAVRLLLDAGADVEAQNLEFQRPLLLATDYARETRELSIVRMLLDAGAQPRKAGLGFLKTDLVKVVREAWKLDTTKRLWIGRS